MEVHILLVKQIIEFKQLLRNQSNILLAFRVQCIVVLNYGLKNILIRLLLLYSPPTVVLLKISLQWCNILRIGLKQATLKLMLKRFGILHSKVENIIVLIDTQSTKNQVNQTNCS
ncbi:Hypothetical_protein [Hexamita inflata]|uniref:Hypothetical_protein n=1 Tax=Hexamita inflata TaxID=28002 RepID=A0AA86N920_9EUKA|nr:Hypothetical protein HINF_LOCUS2904 [Hexamita inflata]